MRLFEKFKKNQILQKIEDANGLGQIPKVLAENGVISVPKDSNYNTFGEPLNHLDANGELPFGWVAYRKDVINLIENELNPIRQKIHSSKDMQSEISAIKMYINYLKEAQKRYSQMGECEGKYFKEYIVDSVESKNRKKRLKYLQEQLKTNQNK